MKDSRRRASPVFSQVVVSPARRRMADGGVLVAAVEKKGPIAFLLYVLGSFVLSSRTML
jgi:hypothetical protein